MAIAVSNLDSGSDSTDQSTAYTTGAVTPERNCVLFVAWETSEATAPTVTVSGLDLTWVPVTDLPFSAGSRRIGLALALVGDVDVTGTLDLTPSANSTGCAWSVEQVTGADAVEPIVTASLTTATAAAASGLTVQFLPGPFRGDSRTFAVFGATAAGAGTATPDGSFAELAEAHYATPDTGLQTQWRSDAHDTSIDVTWDASYDLGGFAVEIRGGALTDYLAALVAAMNDIGARTGAIIAEEPLSTRVASAAALAVVSSVIRLLVVKGYMSEAEFFSAIDAAESTEWPKVPE